ncbi:MAG: hypothetical protein ABGY15_04840, partial [bacterium]
MSLLATFTRRISRRIFATAQHHRHIIDTLLQQPIVARSPRHNSPDLAGLTPPDSHRRTHT